jgi:ferredoxin
MPEATFRIWRGDHETGKFEDYRTGITDGMVVLDAVHQIQAESAPDLACRWNCKAGKCGSCSAEINGKPKLMCMTRLDTLDMTLPEHPRPGHRRLLELQGQAAYQALQTAQAGRPRRHLAHRPARRGACAGVPQVHRVLPVPGRLPRAA